MEKDYHCKIYHQLILYEKIIRVWFILIYDSLNYRFKISFMVYII